MMKYSKLQKVLAPALGTALAMSLLAGCGAAAENAGKGTDTQKASDTEASQTVSGEGAELIETAAPVLTQVDAEGAAKITLTGDSALAEGTGVSVSGGEIVITAGGTYTLSGTLKDGRVVVDAKGEDVTLILEDADITCSYSSPLYVYKAASVVVHLAEGSENVLTDGSAYSYSDQWSSAEDEEPNACLYSKGDLVIQGSGSLTVNGNFNNGVTSKDTLQILSATVTVNAVNHGVTGKDSADLSGAELTVNCGGDALRSTNSEDTALGWVRITDSVLDLTAGEDGIQAETALSVSGGSASVTSGGGYQKSSSDSAKGLKAGTALSLDGGTYVIDSSDDGVHSDGSVAVYSGVFTVTSGDDAFHGDDSLTISGGEINIVYSHEGLESADITVSGGVTCVVASDDGVNAGGGADSSGYNGGWGGNDRFAGGSGSNSITISGGELYILSSGDGLDANGSINMTGGTVLVYSTGNGDGALDYDASFTLTGGTLLAAGGGMPLAPSSAGQNTVYVGFGSTYSSGTLVALSKGDSQVVVELPVSSTYLVYSSPELTDGTWTVSSGGSYSGDFTVGLGSGGSYSGGTQLTTLSLSGGLATYGSTGWGAMGGMSGPGGMGGGTPGGWGGGRGGRHG